MPQQPGGNQPRGTGAISYLPFPVQPGASGTGQVIVTESQKKRSEGDSLRFGGFFSVVLDLGISQQMSCGFPHGAN